MAIIPRLNSFIYTHNQSTSAVTKRQKDGYQILKGRLQPVISKLNDIANQQIPAIEKIVNEHKAPWTSGRVLKFKD